jgi:NAD(P)H-dependent FMN reductase
MPSIAIISSSVRTGRASLRVALYFKNYLEANTLATAELLDLAEYQFPVFNERLKFQKEPSKEILDFAGKIKLADGVIIVTPEYNGGYPASLKNVVDLLYDEWYRKPIAIATVSNGIFGGSQVITSLQFTLWKIRAWTVPAMFPVPKVQEAFDENGTPADKAATDKRAAGFINELLWCMEAKTKMGS